LREGSPTTWKHNAAALLGLAAALPLAQAATRSGEQVVEQVCSACHATGANGAPRIGDDSAWSARAAQGLTSLTRHALEGIRKMPAHGGNPGVSDYEIELAITYMVNHSGGHWAVPIDKSAPPAARSGEQIVREQCVKCHATGVGGAPKIGDHKAWIPRLQYGIGALVRSAIQGHGGMPPRGGMADLSDAEIRSAILYMIEQGTPRAKTARARPSLGGRAQARGDFRLVDGTEIYLGVISADTLREQHLRTLDAESTMHGGIPAGSGYYHVNISLFDGATGEPINDAEVTATVSDPVMGGETKNLELMAIGNAISYGNYFRIIGGNQHTIEVQITRAGAPAPITARFEFTP